MMFPAFAFKIEIMICRQIQRLLRVKNNVARPAILNKYSTYQMKDIHGY